MSKIGKTIGVCATVAAMTASIIAGPYLIAQKNLSYQATQAELVVNSAFETTLKNISNESNVTFNNVDLYNTIVSKIGTNFTVEKLRSIKELQIDMRTFSNRDLSDLKYLINLERLTISNGIIDCSNLSYNQKLTKFTLNQCDFSNSSYLPNSIDEMTINSSKATDSIVSVPYFTKTLVLNNSISNKIKVKNPENLENFSFNGYSFLDLNDLKKCTNLKSIFLTQCPNVYHSEAFKNFNCLSTMELDEFCTVWGDKENIPNLPNKYRTMMSKLDKIASSLVLPDYTDEERIKHLTLFVTSQIEYDFVSISNDRLLTAYNTEPISYALNEGRGVCVGYATLFKALANRVGLDSYQPDNINHTWNMVKTASNSEYHAYDMTQLDNKPIATGTFDNIVLVENKKLSSFINDGDPEELVYYDFTCEEAIRNDQNYSTNVMNITVPDTDEPIGYINIDAPTCANDNNSTRIKIATAEVGILTILGILKKVLFPGKSKQKSKTLYRNNFKQRC